MNTLTKAHFVHNYIINPTNPVTVNLIGAGGTGSVMFAYLVKIDHCLRALGHPGLYVQLFDGDSVSPSNIGRQLFADAEVGQNKAVCLINRANRFSGTDWKAYDCHYDKSNLSRFANYGAANIFLSCVDSVAARFEMAELIREFSFYRDLGPHKPYYWMDCGNSKHTGQCLLATIGRIMQPKSKRYIPVDKLPFITEEFGDLLRSSEQHDDAPSCSVPEALSKQDLFINPDVATKAGALLWDMFREAVLQYRGCFMNLRSYKTEPIPVA